MNNQMMQQLFQQNLTSNPLFQQAQKMAQGKSDQEIMMIARNVCNEKGIDFDSALANFKSMMKGI
jgi:hypothetical protein